MGETARHWVIAARPSGRPLNDSDWRLEDVELPEPKEGQVKLRTLWLGFDPAQKGWMENVGDYFAPTKVGGVMPGSGVAQVVESRHPNYEPGDLLVGLLGWREADVRSPEGLNKAVPGVPPTAMLGALGTPGLTAYFGLKKIGLPYPGDTMVVSGAAGATGSVAGQIGKMAGCKVVGIAGGPEKCSWLTGDLGFDAAIDYKNEDVFAQLRARCPAGIDVYYDNVGGPILNAVLAQINQNARIVLCGGISRYAVGRMPPGPENYFNLVLKRSTMQGFIVLDYKDEFAQAIRHLAGWVQSGALKYEEDVQEGFKNTPRTLMRLFEGKNRGKQILKVAEPA